MRLEGVGKPIIYQWPGGRIRFAPGHAVDVEDSRAIWILLKLPGRVRLAEQVEPVTPPLVGGPPVPPIAKGWYVTYRDKNGTLQGGAEDRVHGTVKECRRESGRWMVYLTDGRQIFLDRIQAVAKTDAQGRVLGAWRVREHGYDGEGTRSP